MLAARSSGRATRMASRRSSPLTISTTTDRPKSSPRMGRPCSFSTPTPAVISEIGPLFDGRLIARRERGFDLLIPFGGCLHRYDARGALIWKSNAHGIEAIVAVDDIDDDGSTEIIASNGKTVFVLDADTGGDLRDRTVVRRPAYRAS